MAGGRGTRIKEIANNIPKPMIKICGKPILEYQIECLKKYGLIDITIVTGYLGYYISDYFGDGNKYGVNISYYNELAPLGTAGALFVIPGLSEDFILLCGDIIFDVDFKRFILFHEKHKSWATLIAHPNGHPYDSSLLVTEIIQPKTNGSIPYDSHKVVQWINKEDERLWYKNRVNAGIMIISPCLLMEAQKGLMRDEVDLDRDILKPLVNNGHIFAYDTPEYIKDMGTPERYREVEKDIKSGLVKQRNLGNKQKAIFLDRDGTINKDVGLLTNIEGMELTPGAADAIKMINKSGYLAIVVTNQPVIARGDLSFKKLQEIHNKLETLLGNNGAYIDALYFCPHHPDMGFSGERLEYKGTCTCRKPQPGMLFQASNDFNINLLQSYMIGDSDTDVLAGVGAGCKSIKLQKNKGLNQVIESLFQESFY
jgi:mannose-1-phosphate guanylyltransferase / phosphomannomutase